MKLKYIVGNKSFIIFPITLNHNDMARINKFTIGDPLGAGFIRFETDDLDICKAVCFGESLSLNIRSREEDKDYIQSHLNIN